MFDNVSSLFVVEEAMSSLTDKERHYRGCRRRQSGTRRLRVTLSAYKWMIDTCRCAMKAALSRSATLTAFSSTPRVPAKSLQFAPDPPKEGRVTRLGVRLSNGHDGSVQGGVRLSRCYSLLPSTNLLEAGLVLRYSLLLSECTL